MDLPDDSVMDDLLMRGEEARRRRSHKKRRLKADEVNDNSNLRPKTEHKPQKNATSYSSWFKEMISHTCHKELSRMESFTYWSAVLVYFPVGLHLLFSSTTTEDHNISTEGYQRICGVHITSIAFLYIILSRASSSMSSSVILGIILFKTVYASACFYLLYLRQYISIKLLYSILPLNIGISFITFILWFHQSPNASIKIFFKTIWQLITPSNCPSHSSSSVVQVLGFVQCILGLFFFIFPSVTHHTFKINPQRTQGYSNGLLSFGFVSSAAIGIIHVFSVGTDSWSFNIAVLFYRVIFSIPLITCLGVLGQIQFGLMLYYVSLDGFCAFVTFVVLYKEFSILKIL